MEGNNRPYCLNKNEEVILYRSGLYKNSLRSGWKLGNYYLTNERLFLFQPPKIVFQVPYKDIISVTTEKRAVVLRTKEVILLTYRSTTHDRISQMLHPVRNYALMGRETDISNRGHAYNELAQDNAILKAWIAVGNLETWRKRIYERALLKIDEDGIKQVLEELDSDSQEILLYLWKKGHANIDELSSVYEVPNHMDILFKIREVINPTAERLLGHSLLSFERSKKDDVTGKIVTYSWWLIGKKSPTEEIKEPMVDIFDEGDYLNIIMELKDVREEDIQVEVARDKVFISTNNRTETCNHEVPLPVEVKTQGLTKRYNNNIIEIRVEKESQLVN